jgi:hypothetical protein
VEQVEKAFKFLSSSNKYPPKELEHLNEEDWLLLEDLLEGLEYEKKYSQIH